MDVGVIAGAVRVNDDLTEADAAPTRGAASFHAIYSAADAEHDATATKVATGGAPDGASPEQALAAKLVRAGKTATPDDVAVVRDYMAAHVPLATMRLMQSSGLHVQVTRGSVATDMPGLAGEQPRGYASGGDWSHVVGTYDASRHAVVIATQDGENGTRRMPDGRDSGSVDALLHEAGHGINYTQSIWHNLSNTDEFIAAYQQDATTGPLARPYFHQDGNPAAGRDEAFAESFAMFNHDPAAMKRDYPHLHDFFDRFMKSQ